METISVSELIKNQSQVKSGEIYFVNLQEKNDHYRARFFNNNYTISFVLNGQKEIFGTTGSTIVSEGQGLIVPAGNSIVSEHGLNDESYNRLLILFPQKLILKFLSERNFLPTVKNVSVNVQSYVHFSNNLYLNEYVKNIQSLITNHISLSYEVALHKLEELLLVLYELYSDKIINLLYNDWDSNSLLLKSLVENNLFNNLSLEELAFLSNRSLSSFKRDFEKNYRISPQKYIRSRKMELALMELEKGKRPKELYDIYGYENVSNFNTAFKKQFGVTPSAYQIKFKS